MSEDWGVFSREVEDKPALISLDFAWLPQAPVAEASELASVHLKLQQPREDGLPTQAESERLAPIENELQQTLQAAGALYVGRVWGNGFRDLYFYANAGFPLERHLAELTREDYQVTSSLRPDPGWQFYLKALAPTAWETQLLETNQTIAQMIESGDDVNLARPVEHYLYLPTQAAREQAIEQANRHGFRVKDQMDNEPPPYPFGLQIVREDAIVPAAVGQAVALLFRLSEDLGGDYDGWASPLVKA